MGGKQCADFSAKDAGVPGLCRMGSEAGKDFTGLVTYTNGVVAKITEPNADQEKGFYVEPSPSDSDRTPIRLGVSEDVVKRMKADQGVEFGSCSAQGTLGVVITLLPKLFKNSPVTWSKGDLKEVLRVLGNTGDNSGNAFLCSDSGTAGTIGINSDKSHIPMLMAAYETLEKDHGALDDVHYELLKESIREAAGIPKPMSTMDYVLEGLKYGGGLLGVAIVFGIAIPWLTKWLGPKDGGGNSGPGGGSKVAYKGTGAAFMNSGGGEAVSAVTTPTVSAPRVQSPSAALGPVLLPNSVPVPEILPELVPVIP